MRSHLIRGPRPTTTPTTCSCAPSSASRATWRSSWSASRPSTTGAPRRVVDGGQRPPHGRRHRGGPDRPAANGHGDRHRGRPRAGAARGEAGRPGLLLPLLVRGAGLAAGHRRGQRADGGHAALLARLARARPQYRPPLAPAHPAVVDVAGAPEPEALRGRHPRVAPRRCPAASASSSDRSRR